MMYYRLWHTATENGGFTLTYRRISTVCGLWVSVKHFMLANSGQHFAALPLQVVLF